MHKYFFIIIGNARRDNYEIIFGATWDFDWAWGNSMGQDTNAPEIWQTTNEWYYQIVLWNRLFIRAPYFIVRLMEHFLIRKKNQ